MKPVFKKAIQVLKHYRRVIPAAVLLVLLLSVLVPVQNSNPVPGTQKPLQVLDRDGRIIRIVYGEQLSRAVTLDEVPAELIQALIATEDHRFYRHYGFDAAAFVRALWTNIRAGHIVQGASTLSMQVARTLRGPGKRGLLAKLAELHLALRLEAWHSKEDLLTLWLNGVSFGNRATGIAAASQVYFGKEPHNLTLSQSTFLVGLPQNPSYLNPRRHAERALARRKVVLAALLDGGHISEETYQRTLDLRPVLIRTEVRFAAPHLVEQIARNTPPGIRSVRTTLDLPLQQVIERLVAGHVQSLRDYRLSNAAVVVLDNATGDVLAYVGSAGFWDEQALGQNDGVTMLRQPGSALKPFTYAAALESRRFTASSILPDLEMQVQEAGAAFTPDNYDRRYHGPVTLRSALANSYNIPAIHTIRALGPDVVLEQLHRAGFASLNRPAAYYGPGLTLGNGEVRLLELARAYAGIARGGTLPFIRWTQNRQAVTGGASRMMQTETAAILTHILSDAEARAPAFGRGGPLELPFPCAVKTGTSKDYRDNVVVGFTPHHTVAVWAGNFDGKPMHTISGVSGAGPLFKAIFMEIGPSGGFQMPDGIVSRAVCPLSGELPGIDCPGTRTEYYHHDAVPRHTCSVHRRLSLDARTGLLADADTPAKFVEKRLFTVFPPEYHAWMRATGTPLPPTVTHRKAVDEASAPAYSDRVRIVYPQSGTMFQMDPVLHADYQRIRLKGSFDPDLFDLRWFVDGKPLKTDVHASDWALKPGSHTIELRAVTADGTWIRSRPSLVRVLDVTGS